MLRASLLFTAQKALSCPLVLSVCLRIIMDEFVIAYMFNRAPQLTFAMVSAAAITMPQHEGAPRGSVEETSTGSTTRGPVEITNEVTSAAMKAAAGITQDANLSEMMIVL